MSNIVAESMELSAILQGKPSSLKASNNFRRSDPYYDEDEDENKKWGTFTQWTSTDGKKFFPAGETAAELAPGYWEPKYSPDRGYFMEKLECKTDGLLTFPETNSERVVAEIQNFWEKEDLFKAHNLVYKRGIILWGPPGCHPIGTKIVMFDGSFKNIEDVVVGDKLMGPDSKPRRVLELRRGKDEMVKITPVKGESFIVNKNHILNLERSRTSENSAPKTLNIKVSDYLELSKPAQNRYKLHHSQCIDFPKNKKLFDPYFVGLWLGDGTEGIAAITSADEEIANYIHSIAREFNCTVTTHLKTSSICKNYNIVGNGLKGGNPIRNALKKIGILKSKDIPQEYLFGSVEERLQLLAGLIDTDGGYSTASWRTSEKFKKKGYKGYFEIIQKRKNLADKIVCLARSLGIGVTCKPCVKGIKKNNFVGNYYRINLFGDIAKIPVLLKRKKALIGIPNKDPLRTGIKSIESIGTDNYYGFTISDDHLYITDDFIIHHNSGKSSAIKLVLSDVVARGGIAIKFNIPQLFIECVRIVRNIQPTTPIVVLMEDIDSIISEFGETDVLNILDGVENVEKVVYIATTNYPEQLGERIINRPSRFDRRFKMPHPSKASRRMYLEHLIKIEAVKTQTIVDLDKWVSETHGMSIAHLKELFIAVCILGDPYDEVINVLRSMVEDKISSEDKPSNMGFVKYDGDE